jgi:phosphatidylglycerol lysyltransferase
VDARRADETAHDGERARVLELLRRHGWNATSFQVLEPAFRYWFDEDACVAYADTGRAHVVAGAPIAAPGRLAEVTERFLEAARRRGRRVCFFGVEARFLEAVPIRATAIGEQAVWDPSAWGAALRTSKSLREQLRRARAKGAQVRLVSPAELADTGGPTRAAVERLVARWLGSRAMAPMGFLVAVEPFAFAAERRTWVAEVGGHVVGFLAAVPVYARGGWLLEDLLRDPEAPNGTAELLVDAAMRAFDDEGARYVTLGLAPLSGPLEGWLRTARDLTGALYDFRGLRAFKAKLRPARWEPIYLAHGDDVPGPRAIVDTLTAFAHGSLARFGLQTALVSEPVGAGRLGRVRRRARRAPARALGRLAAVARDEPRGRGHARLGPHARRGARLQRAARERPRRRARPRDRVARADARGRRALGGPRRARALAGPGRRRAPLTKRSKRRVAGRLTS